MNTGNTGFRRILVMTAVAAEKDAVLRGVCSVPDPGGRPILDVREAGVGPTAAAVATAGILATTPYDLVISAGIGGGFPGRAEVGSLAVAEVIVAADLGVETENGFCSLEEMGLGFNAVRVETRLIRWLQRVFRDAGLPYDSGPLITVGTATGTAETAERLKRRVPGAVAEGMEGYGVALAAAHFRIPAVELRAISNLVGPRDRESWKVAEALEMLTKAFAAIARDLTPK